MKLRIAIALVIVLANEAYGQGPQAQELARALADDATRENAVASVVADPRAKLPLLLSWAKSPPADVDELGIDIGLADAFGRLRAKEAIPFLIQHISIQRWLAAPDVWMKTAEVVQERLPAAAALIKIGPDASRALIAANWDCMSPEDRLAALLVVSLAGPVPGARDFVLRALGEANMQRHWAEEGLKVLN